MWYDFFSVPQPACSIAESNQHTTDELLIQAVASLAAYVAHCQVFLVLAPSVRHDENFLIDYTTWKSRGWCRLERLARALSYGEETRMLLVRRPDTVFEMGAVEWLFDPVGKGSFSVESDKERVGEMTKYLVEQKLQFFMDHGRWQEYRRLMALRTAMFRGLPVDPTQVLPPKNPRIPQGTPAEDFMNLFHLTSPLAQVNGTCPLLLASCAGDCDAIESIIQKRADVQSKEKRNVPAFLVFESQQPVHHAGFQGDTASLKLLVQMRADVNARDCKGLAPLHSAGFCGDVDMVTALLELRADINAKDKINATPLLGGVMRGRDNVVNHLLGQRASVENSPDGLNPLHLAALFGSSEEMVSDLIEAGSEINKKFRPRCGSLLWVVYTALDFSYMAGGRGFKSLAGHHCWEATPLMLAVMSGNHGVAARLVEKNADSDARNLRGRTAAELARIFGHVQAPE